VGARNASEPSSISASPKTILLAQVIPPGLLGIPFWFVDPFRITYRMLISLVCTLQKNVYSVFRADPPSIGFAQLSNVAGGSGERECSLVFPMTSRLLLPFQALQAAMVPQRQPRTMVPQRRPRALEAAACFPLVLICLSISDFSFHCRSRIINQNYIAYHDDRCYHCCLHVLVVIQNYLISLDALNVEALYIDCF
jgi:hypothetical protein